MIFSQLFVPEKMCQGFLGHPVHICVYTEGIFPNLHDNHSQSVAFSISLMLIIVAISFSSIVFSQPVECHRRKKQHSFLSMWPCNVSTMKIKFCFKFFTESFPQFSTCASSLCGRMLIISSLLLYQTLCIVEGTIKDKIVNNICLIEGKYNSETTKLLRNVSTNLHVFRTERVFMFQHSFYLHCRFISNSQDPMKDDITSCLALPIFTSTRSTSTSPFSPVS